MTRDEWEKFKERNQWWWNPLTLPFILLFVTVLHFGYIATVRICAFMGWPIPRPWLR